MGFGVADLSDGVTYSIPSRANGQASSSKAEFMGLLAPIVAMPPRQGIWFALITRASSLNFKIVQVQDAVTTTETTASNTCGHMGRSGGGGGGTRGPDGGGLDPRALW